MIESTNKQYIEDFSIHSQDLSYIVKDIINKELLVLNKEYEAILGRIKELHEIDNNN